eukprot:COSAG05_NODE_1757_length_4139_cov_2.323020_2_plen_455_part_00
MALSAATSDVLKLTPGQDELVKNYKSTGKPVSSPKPRVAPGANTSQLPDFANLGVAQMQRGLLDESKAAFERALSIDPTNEQVLANIEILEQHWIQQKGKAMPLVSAQQVDGGGEEEVTEEQDKVRYRYRDAGQSLTKLAERGDDLAVIRQRKQNIERSLTQQEELDAAPIVASKTSADEREKLECVGAKGKSAAPGKIKLTRAKMISSLPNNYMTQSDPGDGKLSQRAMLSRDNDLSLTLTTKATEKCQACKKNKTVRLRKLKAMKVSLPGLMQSCPESMLSRATADGKLRRGGDIGGLNDMLRSHRPSGKVSLWLEKRQLQRRQELPNSSPATTSGRESWVEAKEQRRMLQDTNTATTRNDRKAESESRLATVPLVSKEHAESEFETALGLRMASLEDKSSRSMNSEHLKLKNTLNDASRVHDRRARLRSWQERRLRLGPPSAVEARKSIMQ